MSVVRYWPVPVIVLIPAIILAGALGVLALARWRAGVPFPAVTIVSAVVALVGILAASLFLVRPAFLAAPRYASPSTDGATALADAERFLESLIAAQSPPGLTAIVVKDGELVYARGFGFADGPRHVAASPDTIYRWWSITKIFTAVATMQLAEQGRLSLDDPVSDHLPEFAPIYPHGTGRVITVRDLLSHSSGMPDAGTEILGWIHYAEDPALNQTALVSAVLPRFSRLASEPGTQGRYTNIGYMLLSAVIESASGEAYEDYVEAHILRPLAMTRTGFDYPDGPAAHVAAGSHPSDLMVIPASLVIDLDRAVRERVGNRLWFERVYPDQTGPSGLVGPAADMARFVEAMLAGGELDGVRILSEESVAAMAERRIDARISPAPGDGFGFGLGWFHRANGGVTSLSHGGQGMGMSSLMTLYPDEALGVLVVGNSTYLGRDFGASAVESLAAVDWTSAAGDPD